MEHAEAIRILPCEAEREFREWAALFPDRLIMAVAVFADDTGTHDETGQEPGAAVAGVCGFLGWDDHWAKLSGEWTEVLNRYNVPAFHFREFADLKRGPDTEGWPYRDWTNPKRHEFLMTLAAIIPKHTQFGLAAFFHKRDYQDIMPAFWKDMGTYPYALCMHLFFGAMNDELTKRWPLATDTKVAYIFDQCTDMRWSGWMNFMYYIEKTGRGKGQRMGTLSFAESASTPPLQAADMMAYRMRQINEKLFLSETSVQRKDLDHAMFPNPKNSILSFYGKDQLKIAADRIEKRRPEIESVGKITEAGLKLLAGQNKE